MPLKTFASKAFPRRKSSGNALEDLDAPSEGFRVLSQYEVAERKQERQDKEKTKSTGRLSAVRPFASPAQKGRHQSFDDDSGTSNRYVPGRAPFESPQLTSPSGSNSSSGANSALSRLYDTSSSARYSSSSTLPSSSTDQEDDNNIFAHKHHHTADNHTFSIRGAARTFTFGGRTQKSPILPPVPPLPADPEDNIFAPPLGGHTRDRSLTTTSSASTALPPKVDSLSLGMADFGGEFDDIFAGLDRRQSPKPNSLPKPPVPGIFRSESEPMLAVPPKVPPKAFATSRQLQAPDPIRIDKSKEIEPSPFSWDSRASHDGLLPSPHSPDSLLQDPLPAVPPHRQLTPSPSSPPTASRLAAPNAVQRKAVAKPASSRVPSDNSVNLPAAAASKASKASPSREFNPSVALTPTPGAGLFDSDQFSFVGSDDTPRPAAATLAKKPVTPEPDFMAVKPSAGNSPGSRPGANKVMNQAQFNKYRQHKEQEDAKATVESDSDASDGDYEQDEEERNKELQRQRRKQEGHLAVWRQQMHKVTGEKPLPFQQRTSIDRPMSQFDLFAPKKEQSDSDEGDEETPLAILMAHGFPTKTRPPTKPTGPFASKLPVESHSTTDLRLSMGPQSQAAPIVRPASSHGQRPSSIAGSGAAEKRSSALPAFARNLPPDPYFGASLVSAPNRESLAFGHAGPGSTYGGAGGAASSQNPAGQTLVNVIANEERAKAMRRGSPNAQNGFGPSAPSAPANSMNMNPGMPMQMQTPMGMSGMHMNSQSADMTQQMMAQLVLNQQYLQQQLAQSQALMMQMAQGQMGGMAQMQQMQHMQQMGGMPPMQAPGNPAFGQNRPMSLYSVGMPSQRAVSMVGMPQLPPMPSQQPSVGFAPSIALIPPPTNGYAPSIAPSERSTVGMARRYRPVSHMPGSVAGFDSTPTMTSSTLPPIPSDDGAPTKGNARPISKSGKKGILAVLKRSNKENQAEEDEDDWGGMTTRKSKWLSKGGDGGATKEPGLRELYVDGI